MGIVDKETIYKLIDEIMGDRNIDTIRKALITLKERVEEISMTDISEWHKDWDLYELDGDLMRARLKLRGNNPINESTPYFDGAEYLVIDTMVKLDTRLYGEMYYE